MHWIFLFFLTPLPTWAADLKNICPHIRIEDGKLKLNDNEKVLVCGSKKGPDSWQEVPVPQAQMHLKSILENLGYMNPRFERNEENLHVWLGKVTETKSFVVRGADGILDPGKKRKILGEPLIPEKFNEVEAWANAKMRSQGYACPKLSVEAHVWDSSLVLNTEPGGVKKYGRLEPDDMDNLNPDVLDRYQTFRQDDVYDIRQTEVMVSRILNDGLFQSAYFTTECVEEAVNLKLHTSVGKPKILNFGVGASTEELPFADLTFRNARLDNKASSFTTSLHASPRRESLTLSSELYFFPGWHRAFLGPRFLLERKIESAYQTDTAKTGADLGIHWDAWRIRLDGRGGPTLNSVKTARGSGPANATYPTLEGSVTVTSLEYESSLRDQYEGWTASFLYRGQGKGLGSQVSVNRYESNLKYLWNMRDLAPPLFVLATRFQGITVDTDDIDEGDNRDLIPIEDRIYAGGDQNLRGFGRQSLNNSQLGYLSQVYLGLELRLVEELPYHLQPFLLWDGAQLGSRRYTIEPSVFISEGLGLRWPTPFGTLRGSAARGRILKQSSATETYNEQWVYFLSFGQEF